MPRMFQKKLCRWVRSGSVLATFLLSLYVAAGDGVRLPAGHRSRRSPTFNAKDVPLLAESHGKCDYLRPPALHRLVYGRLITDCAPSWSPARTSRTGKDGSLSP